MPLIVTVPRLISVRVAVTSVRMLCARDPQSRAVLINDPGTYGGHSAREVSQRSGAGNTSLDARRAGPLDYKLTQSRSAHCHQL